MKNTTNYSRRRFMQHSALGLAVAAALPGWVFAMEMSGVPKLKPRKATPGFTPDVELDITAQPGSVQLLSGKPTQVLQYAAKLLKGPDGTLTQMSGSYLGPILRFQKGQKVRINFFNQLDQPHIVHWHGLHVPADVDGHPMNVIAKGESYVYEFEILNRAGFHFYHPHPHELLGRQLYSGLAGGIIINDEEEGKLGLPSGEFEIPVVIQDRHFDDNNQLVYGSTMHDRTMGFLGDKILVNGHLQQEIEVSSRAYRLRVLNGSNSRIYKLGWSDGSPVTVIGTDGGLLEKPQQYPYVMLAPGERLDVWADFSGKTKGSEVSLKSLPFHGVLPKMAEQMMAGGGMGGMGGMGHGMMGSSALPVGSEYTILKARVAVVTSDSPKLPGTLSSFKHYTLDDVANRNKPIPIGISEGPGSMLLNGRPYKFNDVQPGEHIPVNSVQLLEIFHAHGGAGGGGHGRTQTGEGEHAPASKPESTGGGMGMMGHGMMGQGMGGMKHESGGSSSMGGMGMMGKGMGGMNHESKSESGSMGGMNHGSGGESGMGGMGMGGGMGGMNMMFSMAHPIHLHGQQFEIISRSMSADESEAYSTVKDGLVHSCLKDTVLVMPGEKVRIIKPFQDFKGVFVYHCHNIEHEDLGMMRDFLIE